MTPEEGLSLEALKLLMDERDRRYEQRFEAQDTAVEKAAAQMEKRLDGMNEFRDQLRDQTATFLSRAEYTLAHNALTAQVDRNTDDISTAKGKGLGLNAGWMFLVGFLGIAASVIAIAIALSK